MIRYMIQVIALMVSTLTLVVVLTSNVSTGDAIFAVFSFAVIVLAIVWRE